MRAALLLLSGNALAALLLLARNLVVARLLPVADYGVAASFAIVVAAMEMASELGLQQQILQSRRGGEPRFQAALQGFQLLRGALAALALWLMAPQAAAFMGAPEAAGAYRALALVPLCKGLVHLDLYRLGRGLRFGPLALGTALPALGALLVGVPLALWLGDWRAMLWSVLAQAVLMVLVSHLLAERRWRVVLDRAAMAESLRFGWPLLLNGVLLFGVFNGDRIVVARELGLEALGLFAMACTLTLTPAQILRRSAQSFYLPQLAAAQAAGAADRFDRLAAAAAQAHLAMAVALVAAVAACGAPLVGLVLGPAYLDMLPYLGALALVQALWLAKGGPAVVALARGRTGNAVASNLLRVAALPLALWLAARTGRVEPVIAVGLLAEAGGLMVALWLARRRAGMRLGPVLRPLGPVLLLMGLAVAGPMTGLAGPAGALALAALGLTCLLAMPELRRHGAAPA
ncbi:oligosaccharide flippase family protein [Limimaricola pyoseonensis]|uniref:Polysaccharide biosynthesis protein n=1 Tax=Limimaricola pyoseonensis TaxID=521013 RepID=A0A1G7IWD4_9RHOB|nr:oligosaccharide flippase family protein [Limimaricola pyoseonensis]SDF16928.1 Polysaccharide biosynthesis protein [Limimaricola pyoseonensis]